MKRVPRIFKIAVIAGSFYIIGFYSLMIRGKPAWDGDGQIQYTCIYRFTESFPVYIKHRTRMFEEVSFWNKVFYPAEWLHNRLSGKGNLLDEMRSTNPL